MNITTNLGILHKLVLYATYYSCLSANDRTTRVSLRRSLSNVNKGSCFGDEEVSLL